MTEITRKRSVLFLVLILSFGTIWRAALASDADAGDAGGDDLASSIVLTAGLLDKIHSEWTQEEVSLLRLVIPEDLSPRLRIEVEMGGEQRTLVLEQHSLRSAKFRMLVQVEDGRLEEVLAPSPRTYLGWIDGEQGSRVAASLIGTGLYASIIRNEAETLNIRPLRLLEPSAPRDAHISYRSSQILASSCGVKDDDSADREISESEVPDGGGAGENLPCNVTLAEVAFDSDYEFFEDDCEGDPDTCMAIVEAGLNITNQLYLRDVKIFHQLSTVVIRTLPDEGPYAQFPDGSDFGGLLTTLRSHWNNTMGDVDFDVAYLLTGKSRPEYGGLAYVGVVCSSSRYGVGIGGWGYEGIFRHELGHNWGAGHSCGTERRYIMCGNSISAISAYNVRRMSSHRDSRNCLGEIPLSFDPAPPFLRLDRAVRTLDSGVVAIDVLSGDTDINCETLGLDEFDESSALGSSIRLVDNIDGGDSLLYVPGLQRVGTDFFEYRVVDESGFEAAGPVLVETESTGLVVHLPLDETSGDEAEDISGNGFEGELRADLTFDVVSTPGRFGSALLLSGVDGEYLSLGDESAFDVQSAMTVSSWFRVDGFGAGGSESLVSKGGDAWRLKRDGDASHLKFTCSGVSVEGSSGGNLIGSVDIDDGEWHHAVGVYDGARISLYIDGVLDQSRPASGLIQRNSSSMRVGDNAWNGAIDDIRLYNYGLGDQEVASLFNASRVEDISPKDGARGIVPGTPLRWIGSPAAQAYRLYLGTDCEAVGEADSNSPEYAGQRIGSSYTPSLERDEKYFWRLDVVTDDGISRGGVRSFSTAFAYCGFDEADIGDTSYTSGPGDAEIGFQTTRAPTGGDSPLAQVMSTGSTETSPVFSHRSVAATTRFDFVDIANSGVVAVSIKLQARSTGYEVEDSLEIYATDGEARIYLLRLPGPVHLTQRAGTGYSSYAAVLPTHWTRAQLVVETSSNSSSGSERYDFDSVSFFEVSLDTRLAATYFEEASVGADSFTAGPGDQELSFQTESSGTSGADPLVAVVASGSSAQVQYLSHRSVDATTTFENIDLGGRSDVFVRVIIRVHDTSYESGDELEIYVSSGGERIALIDAVDGAIEGIAEDEPLSLVARLPDAWDDAVLTVHSRSNSSAGSERIDILGVEFLVREAEVVCGADVQPEVTFRRGDANADGNFDLSDGVTILNYLFLGGELDCLDASDSDDNGAVDLTDGIRVFNFLFLGGAPPPAPGPNVCGADPTEDNVDCELPPDC